MAYSSWLWQARYRARTLMEPEVDRKAFSNSTFFINGTHHFYDWCCG